MNPIWSYALTSLGALGLWVASSRRVGWLLLLAAQPVWLVYAVSSRQWGFVGHAATYGVVAWRNWLKTSDRKSGVPVA